MVKTFFSHIQRKGVSTLSTKQKPFKIKAAPIESFDAHALYKLKFSDAAQKIREMDTHQKAAIVFEINLITKSLYNIANRYGNDQYKRDEQITSKQFEEIIRKIKHWETLLYWLFEIDVLMEKHTPDHLAELANEQIQQEIAKWKQKCKEMESYR